jgi:hypothetical protein
MIICSWNLTSDVDQIDVTRSINGNAPHSFDKLDMLSPTFEMRPIALHLEHIG